MENMFNLLQYLQLSRAAILGIRDKICLIGEIFKSAGKTLKPSSDYMI